MCLNFIDIYSILLLITSACHFQRFMEGLDFNLRSGFLISQLPFSIMSCWLIEKHFVAQFFAFHPFGLKTVIRSLAIPLSILCKRLPRLVEDSNVNNFLRLSFAPLTYSSQKSLYYLTKRAPQRDKAPSFKPAEFYCKGKSLLYSCDLHIREFMAFACGKVLFLCRFKQTNNKTVLEVTKWHLREVMTFPCGKVLFVRR